MNYAEEFQKYCLSMSLSGMHRNNGNPLFPYQLNDKTYGIHIQPYGNPLEDKDAIVCSWVLHLKSKSSVKEIKDQYGVRNILTWKSKESAQNSIDSLVEEAKKFGKLDWIHAD